MPLRHAILRPAACLLMTTLFPTFFAKAAPTAAELLESHRQAGQAMDARYYTAGRLVDLAIYDFEELARQGRPAPRELVQRTRDADARLRQRWLALEQRRQEIRKQISQQPPRGRYVLRIDNLESGLGSSGWWGLRWARLEWPDGTILNLDPKVFQNGAYREKYEYMVAPSSASFVYSGLSSQNVMQAGIDAENRPSGNANLVISGVDGDTPGATRIRISLNGTTLFEGPNTFRPDGWTERSFPIPARAFDRPVPGRSAEELATDLDKLRRDVDQYGSWADTVATNIVRVSTPVRTGLVPKPLSIPMDFWKTQFVRGMCYVPFAQEYTHHMRTIRQLNANMLYSYTGLYNEPSEFPATLAEVRKVGLPYYQYRKGMAYAAVDSFHWSDPPAMVRESVEFLRSVEGKSGVPVHLSVDEPNIFDNVADVPGLLEIFRRALEIRRPALEKAGIHVPRDPVPVTRIEKPEDRPLWMEWQYFKARHMGRHFASLWDGVNQEGRYPFVIIQDHQGTHPQQASYVTMGAALPWISTDLYSNGTLREAFSLQLLRNAAMGRTVLTAGAGYSCKTPDRFRRSMAVGMTHSDGVLQWTDIYLSKYRDHKAFWKSGTDDQGRDMLANWNPQYWGITQDYYRRMAWADRYLGGGSPVTRAAVLYSERTAISQSDTTAHSYVLSVIGVYSDLVRWGKPVEVRYVENLTPEALRRLKVIVLPEAQVLSEKDVRTLREWVRNGGMLITSGDTSLTDEWGRPQKDFRLADVFGVTYRGEGRWMDAEKPDANPMGRAYIRVRETTAKVRETLGNGDPFILENRFGNGRAVYYSTRRMGVRTQTVSVPNGLPGKGPAGYPEKIRDLVFQSVPSPGVELLGAPEGVEMQLRRKGNAYVMHLVDWYDNRTVSGLKVRVQMPGAWKVTLPTEGKSLGTLKKGQALPLRSLRLYDLVVLTPEKP